MPQAQWPQDIAHHWQRYRASRAFDLRETTLAGYDGWLACYVGYGVRVEQPPMDRWDHLFDADRVARFVTWHAKRGVGDRAAVVCWGCMWWSY